MAVVLNEPSRAEVEAKTAGKRLLTPGCIHWEMGNALYNAIKRSYISEQQAKTAYQEFSKIPIQILDVDILPSLHISAKHKIPAYDAYYLQCAIDRKRPILTLDGRMSKIAENLGISVL